MYKRSDKIELGLLGKAALLLYGGYRLHLPFLTALGGASIGMFSLVAGIAAIRKKRVGFETRQKNFGNVSVYTGLAAQLFGILFTAFALLIFILVWVGWFSTGGIEAFWASLLGKPLGWGIILLCIGGWVTVTGIVRLLAGSAGYYKGLADKVERLSGVLPLVFGLALAGIGLLLIVFPGVFLRVLKQGGMDILQLIFH